MSQWFEKFVRSASWIMWLGRGVFLAVVILLVMMRSVITVIRIDGHSMDPTLQNGQWVFVDLISKRLTTWTNGDIVILRFPGDPLHSLYVKRIIGIPGDQITLIDGKVLRNNKALREPYLSPDTVTENGIVALPSVVPADKYLVLGDNRLISNDSRFFGLVPVSDLVGKVVEY